LKYLDGEGIFGDCINTDLIISLKCHDLALLIKGHNQDKGSVLSRRRNSLPGNG